MCPRNPSHALPPKIACTHTANSLISAPLYIWHDWHFPRIALILIRVANANRNVSVGEKKERKEARFARPIICVCVFGFARILNDSAAKLCAAKVRNRQRQSAKSRAIKEKPIDHQFISITVQLEDYESNEFEAIDWSLTRKIRHCCNATGRTLNRNNGNGHWELMTIEDHAIPQAQHSVMWLPTIYA